MANHCRRILRNWRHITTSTSLTTIYSENGVSFFGVGDFIPLAEKMSFYGNLWVTIACGSTGGGGQRIPIAGYRTPNQSNVVMVAYGAAVENLFIGTDRYAVMNGGSTVTIQAKGYYSGLNNIVSVTLDIIATGGHAQGA